MCPPQTKTKMASVRMTFVLSAIGDGQQSHARQRLQLVRCEPYDSTCSATCREPVASIQSLAGPGRPPSAGLCGRKGEPEFRVGIGSTHVHGTARMASAQSASRTTTKL